MLGLSFSDESVYKFVEDSQEKHQMRVDRDGDPAKYRRRLLTLRILSFVCIFLSLLVFGLSIPHLGRTTCRIFPIASGVSAICLATMLLFSYKLVSYKIRFETGITALSALSTIVALVVYGLVAVAEVVALVRISKRTVALLRPDEGASETVDLKSKIMFLALAGGAVLHVVSLLVLIVVGGRIRFNAARESKKNKTACAF